MAATLVLWEFWTSPSFWLAPVCAAALTFFSVVDVFTSSHAVNFEEAEAQNDFLNVLIHLEAGSSPLSAREKMLAGEAFNVCALQENQDQQELVLGAQKALYFGPALTLADGVNSALAGERPVRCLDYYRELRKTQAQLFLRMEARYPWLLANPSN
ncbi:hypothetical protein QNM99_03650 [Pseudomonas sp. PCH446]